MTKKKSLIPAALVIGVLLGGAITGSIAMIDRNQNAYVYSQEVATVDGKRQLFWTLQIPDRIKFTYEKENSPQIAAFVKSVDDLNKAFGWTEKNRNEAERAFRSIPVVSIP